MMNYYKRHDIRPIGSKETGYLSCLELDSEIDFKIERIYYIYDAPQNAHRGLHAHKELEQVIFCPHGEVVMILDDGVKRNKITLDSPEKLLIIKGLIWREMVWKKEDSILCVGASDKYDESDYIRDYTEFLSIVNGGSK